KPAIGTNCSKCAMMRMKGDVIDGKDILVAMLISSIGSVALECEIVFGILRIDILNSNSSFNTSQRKPNRSIFIRENRHTSVLEFEWRFNSFELLRLSFQLVNDNSTTSSSHYSHR